MKSFYTQNAYTVITVLLTGVLFLLFLPNITILMVNLDRFDPESFLLLDVIYLKKIIIF
jgi:hypothetical protein